MMFHPDDQPDRRNAPPAADIREIILFRDMNHVHAGNVLRMLQGIRDKDAQFNGAVLRYTLAGARNMLEASLASLDAVEAECLFHLAERESLHPFVNMPKRRVVPDAALPATVSPGALS